MPALKKRYPSYRLHRASGQAVVTLCGKDHYLGPHGSPESREKYDRHIAQWLANGRTAPSRRTDRVVTIDYLLALYWQHVQSYYVDEAGAPTSEVDSYRQVMKPLRQLYGPLDAGDFGAGQFKAIRQTMIDRRLVRRSINQRMKRIKRIFRWGVEQELVPPDVVSRLDAVSSLMIGRSEAVEKPAVTPVRKEDVDAVLCHLTRPVRAMVEVQLLTGMRPGEVVQMRRRDLDQSDPMCWSYRPTRHKNKWRGKDRIIFLGPKSQRVLKPFLARAEDAYLFCPAEAVPDRRKRASVRSGRKPGACYSVSSYDRAVARACRRARVHHWSPNQLRHTCATELRRKRGLETSSAVLGHSKVETTQVYADQNTALARAAAIAEG